MNMAGKLSARARTVGRATWPRCWPASMRDAADR